MAGASYGTPGDSLLAGQSSEVVEWFRENGRSSGVRAGLATQRPSQLSPSVWQPFIPNGGQ